MSNCEQILDALNKEEQTTLICYIIVTKSHRTRGESQSGASAAEIKVQREDDSSFFFSSSTEHKQQQHPQIFIYCCH